MIAGLIIGCYVAGFVIAARIYVMTSDEHDRGEARFNGTVVGLLWPLALIFAVGLGLLSLPTLGAKTKRERQHQAHQAAETAGQERQKLKARIAELEREAGIPPT